MNQLKEIGGSSKDFYVTDIVLIQNKEVYSIKIKEDEFVFTSNLCSGKRNFDLLIRLEYDDKKRKYFCQLTEKGINSRGYRFDQKVI